MNTKLGKHGGPNRREEGENGKDKVTKRYTQLTVNNFLKCLYVTVIRLCVYLHIHI